MTQREEIGLNAFIHAAFRRSTKKKRLRVRSLFSFIDATRASSAPGVYRLNTATPLTVVAVELGTIAPNWSNLLPPLFSE